MPGLDDGPRSIGEAVALASQLAHGGVQRIVCTPHYSRRYPTDATLARARLSELAAAIEAAEIPLLLSLGAEVASATSLTASDRELAERQLPGGHLLVELERDTPSGFIALLLERAAALGLTPVLAHPERCRAVRCQLRLIDAARAHGALVQVVAPSLVGAWGEDAARAAWQLLETGRADLLGSDAHRPRANGQHLARAIDLMVRRLPSAVIGEVTVNRPARLFDSGHPR